MSVVLGKHETTSRMDERPDGTDRTQEWTLETRL